MYKIITIIGARPQFIKAAPVSKACKQKSELTEIVVHTGQHYDTNMSHIFFNDLEMNEPEYNLGIGGGSHAQQTGKMMIELEKILEQEKPHLVLVYGDTNSTLAGSLTATKLHIPIAHVEAGLRSFDRKMSEEINRTVTDTLSNLLFAPTREAIKNLRNEGVSKGIFNTGDVMYDVALQFKDKAEQTSKILIDLHLNKEQYILCTVHRAENTDSENRLKNIFTALKRLAKDMPVVLPLHPRTRKMLNTFHLTSLMDQILIIEPAGFLDMIHLERNAKIILTDSGGIQKEAYFHAKPCITLRNTTEWVETIAAGWNQLVDVCQYENIVTAVHDLLGTTKERGIIEEYGRGDAAKKIIEALIVFSDKHYS